MEYTGCLKNCFVKRLGKRRGEVCKGGVKDGKKKWNTVCVWDSSGGKGCSNTGGS